MRIFKTKTFARWARKEGFEDAWRRAFFIFGFAKNERANIDVLELRALKLMAKTLLEKSDTKLNKDLEANVLVEVRNYG